MFNQIPFLLLLLPSSFFIGDDFIQRGECLDKLLYVEAVILESLRMAQQSITLRKAMKDLTMETENGSVHVPKGWYVGTLLSVTNTHPDTLPSVEGIAPLDTFDPNRFLNAARDKVHRMKRNARVRAGGRERKVKGVGGKRGGWERKGLEHEAECSSCAPVFVWDMCQRRFAIVACERSCGAR